ncbi:MAG: beta-propeller fold lactonase family protein [Chroococcidiopsidaceae cyanobacterium CP_BM_ER_R8_30]|nr:beta-propeller fold lactonase family protein [Chroococcidiopsidaceae cyanobacterium CP_BM_ER_R8_30]
MLSKRRRTAFTAALLSAALFTTIAGRPAKAEGGDGDADNTGAAPLPTGQLITPTFATGAAFKQLPYTDQEYTQQVGNYPYFTPDGAISSTLSPDGKTLAVVTSGYNTLDNPQGNLLGTGAEFVVLFDVSNPRSPVMKQTLRPANTFDGLVFGPDGTLYVSGGNDDQVLVYKNQSGQYALSTTISLGHNKQGNGAGQYPQAAGLAVSKDGSRLVVANSLNDSISVYDLTQNNYPKLLEYDLRPYNTSGQNGVPGGETLYGVAIKGNNTVYAASVRDREVDVVDISNTASPSLIKRIQVPGSPNNILLSNDQNQSTLYVTQDNSDEVAAINTATNAISEEIDAIAPPGKLTNRSARYTGAATNNLALSPDGNTLYVTNGGANALAIIPVNGPGPHTVAALVPTGWYPTTVTVSQDGGTLYVFNNKSDPGANPQHHTSSTPHLATVTYPGGNTSATTYGSNQYILQLEGSGIQTLPTPSSSDYASLTSQVAANNHWNVADYPSDDTVMNFLHQHIQHVIYIVKENRTYDQILGDLNNGANGDPSLAIFGQRITPNFHSISQNFVTLDNFFCSGEVSGNGWPWSTASRETDWNEKNIPMDYAFSVTRENAPYDAEGQNRNISVHYFGPTPSDTVQQRQAEAGGYDYTQVGNSLPGGVDNLLPGPGDDGAPDGPGENNSPSAYQSGYIWDAALAAGLTVRNYGFFSDNSHYGLNPGDPGYVNPVEDPEAIGARQEWTAAQSLIPYTDIYFHGFDNAYPDVWRLEEWEREFAGFVKNGNLPNLVLLRYMHDHMGNFPKSGSGLGGAESSAEVEQADNDFAVGKTLELLANSPYAGNTLVFVLEDDAQDGPDHMDAHRSTAYIVGPYVRQHAIVSTRYSTVNMLRTIEDVLGISHLNLFDAYQRPMSDVFNINQGPAWTYSAVASTLLKTTTLNLSKADPQGKPVQYAKGPDLKPTHKAAWWAYQTRSFDFSSEDRLPADQFNRVIWRGMMGNKPYPTERSGLVMHGQETKKVAQASSQK